MFSRFALIQRSNSSRITTVIVNTHSDLQIVSVNMLQQRRVIHFLFQLSFWNSFLLLFLHHLLFRCLFGCLWSIVLFLLFLFLISEYFGLCANLWHRVLRTRSGCSGNVAKDESELD